MSCIKGRCECDNGEPVEEALCTEHGKQECQECSDFFHMEKSEAGTQCLLNKCYCDFGEIYGESSPNSNIVDTNCPSHGMQVCQPGACEIGYDFDESLGHCVDNGFECSCDDGIAATREQSHSVRKYPKRDIVRVF